MPQIQIVGPSRASLVNEELGRSIGQGLGQFATNYYANKSLEEVLQDPNLKNAPLSEKQSRLQQALQPYGEVGENIFNKNMSIFQQQAGENMMKKARKIANDPKSTPSDILFALAEGTQGIPGAEKYVGPVFQTLMQQRQAKALTGAGQEGMEPQVQKQQMPQFQVPGRTQQPPIQEQTSLSPQPVTQPSIGPEKKGITQVPAQERLPGRSAVISPEQHAAMRKSEIASGGDGSITDSHINAINSSINQGRKMAEEDRQWLVSNQELERGREQAFRDYAQPKFKKEFGDVAPLEQVRMDQYAKQIDAQDIENGIINTPADLYEKTRQRMNDYLTYKGRLEGTPIRKNPTTGETVYKGGLKERPTILNMNNPKDNAMLDSSAEMVRPLVMMGEDDEVRRILASKGYYSDEGEDIINRTTNPNWKKERDDFKNSIGSVRSLAKETESLRNVPPEKVQERRNKEVDNLVKGLEKSLNPSSSLILLWREAEHSGYDSEVFTEALTKLRRNGYNFTPRQIRDLPEVNKPTMSFMRKIFG